MDEQQKAESSGAHFLDYWRVIRSRKEIILAVLLLVILTGTAVTFMMPKYYKSVCRIIVKQDADEMSPFSRTPMQHYSVYFLLTEYEVIRSKQILYKVIDNLNLQRLWGEKYTDDDSILTKKDCYNILRNRIEIEQVRNTSTISITATSEDPEEAKRISNEIATVYLEERYRSKITEVKQGIEALKDELSKQNDKVSLAEAEVERIRKEKNLTIYGRYTPSQQRVAEMEGTLIQYRVDMISRQKRLQALEDLEGEELIEAANFVVFDSSMQSIRKQLMDLELSLTLMLQELGAQHPDVLRVKAGIAELEERLQASLRGMKTGLRADYEVAKAKYDALEQELVKIKQAEIDAAGEDYLPFEKAQRNVRIQRTILDALDAKIAQEGIVLQMPKRTVKIFEPAEAANRPYSPRVALLIGISVVVGLIAGIGLAYFIEYLDTSVKTVDDIESYLGLSVVGVIPQKVKPLIHEGIESPHSESYRVLRTNIQFTNKGVGGGAFCVVSGGVGEGKSTTLFNLAYVCAQMGDKVLIVDSDLRRPVQHSILGMSNRFGLTNVLMRDVPVEETIKTTSVNNLHFLPSGKLPRNSVGMLDTQRIRDLIKNLKARYDYVFFDSPPIMGVSDASIIASEVDGVLLVVQYRKYPRVMSARSKRLIENVGGNIVGVVLNNINVLKDDYYYYYHSYYSTSSNVDDNEPAPEVAAVASEKGDERY